MSQSDHTPSLNRTINVKDILNPTEKIDNSILTKKKNKVCGFKILK